MRKLKRKMKNMKKLFLILAIGGILVGCTKREHEEIGNENDKTPIILTSKVDFKTKNTLQDVQIKEEQTVGFFVQKGEDIIYNNNELVADGNGNFSCISGTMYYPIAPGTVDFYAVHPYTATATGLATINFSINGDQTSEENLLNSDLLYVKKTGVAKTNKKQSLAFEHKLSKVAFRLIEGPGIDLEGLSNVEILGILPKTTLDMTDGSITAASGTKINVKAYGVAGSSNGEVSGIGAIVVPQTIAAGTKLFKIVINGEDFFYTLSEDISFESGTKHSYALTISNTGIEVSSSITDWISGDEISGEGILIFE